jgi:hypothetical protein
MTVTAAALTSMCPAITSTAVPGASDGAQPKERVKANCGSKSTASTRRPACDHTAARFDAVVVFPTPPFCELTANVRAIFVLFTIATGLPPVLVPTAGERENMPAIGQSGRLASRLAHLLVS